MVNNGETDNHDALFDLAQAGANVMNLGYGQVLIKVYNMDGSLAFEDGWTAESFVPGPRDSS